MGGWSWGLLEVKNVQMGVKTGKWAKWSKMGPKKHYLPSIMCAFNVF
jgi:hypothetical protein